MLKLLFMIRGRAATEWKPPGLKNETSVKCNTSNGSLFGTKHFLACMGNFLTAIQGDYFVQLTCLNYTAGRGCLGLQTSRW